MSDAFSANAKPPGRSYPPRTLKILFAFCGNRCAYPECTEPIIANATPYSEDLVVGHIAHIYAHSDKGPRGRPGMKEGQRNQTDNLMLFCPTHHAIVDGQHETYPAALLQTWKERHERRYRDGISTKLTDIGYAELEVAARALITAALIPSGDYRIISPSDKIGKNELGAASAMLLTLGAAKSREVERMLLNAAQLDEGFPDRLRSGFVAKYQALTAEGLAGDDLFLGIYEWAGGALSDKAREVAGLCILAHLFVICDVFEK